MLLLVGQRTLITVASYKNVLLSAKLFCFSLRLLTIGVVVSARVGAAQVLEVLHSFTGTDGAGPSSGLVEAVDGSFYGTTVNGGTGRGTVFRLGPSWTLSTIVTFAITNGTRPYPGLVLAADGRLYGVTTYGGPTNANNPLGYGTVFNLATDGLFTTLTFFGYTNGASCYTELVQGGDGNFYAGTDDGGTHAGGTLFRISAEGTLITLVDLTQLQGRDPNGPFVEMADGSFYGTTVWGGPPNSVNAYGSGTVFKLTTNGVLTSIAVFDGETGGRPQNMIRADDGNFYGTTMDPAPGSIFKMTSDGVLTMLYWFNGSDGDSPEGGIVQAKDHFLYGTTEYGGDVGEGNVFRISTSGFVQNLISFHGTNGNLPTGRLLQASDGNLYGTTYSGGASNLGTIFRIVFPHLALAQVDGRAVLSWSTNQIGFTLQVSEDLSSGAWIDCTNLPTIVGDQLFVTNSMTAGTRFYRLRK